MQSWIPSSLSAVLVLGIACAPVAEQQRAEAPPPALELRVGQPFPALVLPGLEDGRPLSLADFRGQKVLLHVFASW
ncbi:MAG: hypothetical protein V3U98_00715 [Acidobacteriota bacterium]